MKHGAAQPRTGFSFLRIALRFHDRPCVVRAGRAVCDFVCAFDVLVLSATSLLAVTHTIFDTYGFETYTDGCLSVAALLLALRFFVPPALDGHDYPAVVRAVDAALAATCFLALLLTLVAFDVYDAITPVPDFLSLKHRGMSMPRVLFLMFVKVGVAEIAALQPLACVKHCVRAANVGLFGVGAALFARDVLFNSIRFLFVAFSPVGGSGEWPVMILQRTFLD